MGLNGPTESNIASNQAEEIKDQIERPNDSNDNNDSHDPHDTHNSKSNHGHDDDDSDDVDTDKDQRFTEGEPLTFIRVRFPGNAKSQPFLLGKRSFVYGQKVLAMSDRGMTVGYVNSFPYERPFTKSMLPLRTISKLASQEEIDKQTFYQQQEKEAASSCNRLIEKYRLEMNLTHVEFMQFGKKVVFYFNAPARVDFRELVKELVGELKMRVELRQISVRDRTAALGAIGVCGLQTCCSSFLKNYGHVSIKMAKNQNLALIPSKINGICGQIKCCIKYEDEVYTDKRSLLPREGSFIETKNGDRGRVDRLHIFIEQFDMLTEHGQRRRYARNQFDKKIKLPSDWKFPDRFDHITNETSNVIGLAEEEKLQALRYQQMWQEGDDEEDDDYVEGENDSNEDDADQGDEDLAEDSDEDSDEDSGEDSEDDSEENSVDEDQNDDGSSQEDHDQSAAVPAKAQGSSDAPDSQKRNRDRSNQRRPRDRSRPNNRDREQRATATERANPQSGEPQKKRRRNRNRRRPKGGGGNEGNNS